MQQFLKWKEKYEKEESSGHAVHSPSASARWLECTRSYRLNLKPSPTSEAAEIGTIAQALAEFKLNNLGFQLKKVLNQVINGHVVDDEMVYHVQDYCDTVMFYIDKNTQYGIEEKVKITDDCWGTSDFYVFNPKLRELHLFDLKYGVGIGVSEVNNTQLMIYAAGLLMTIKNIHKEVDKIFLHIYQPRYKKMEKHRFWEISKEDLKKWTVDVLLPTIKDLNDDTNLEFSPGEKTCQWCQAKGNCRARTAHGLEVAKVEFNEFKAEKTIVVPRVNEMSNDELSKFLKLSAILSSLIKDVPAEALKRVQAGEEIVGFKQVLGRKNRIWKEDENTTAARLVSFVDPKKIFIRKLITPAQAEKKAVNNGHKKKDIAELIITPKGAPTIAPMFDKRPAILNSSAKEEFKNLII